MPQFRLAIDIGGTFTDVVLENPDGARVSAKTLTTPGDPVTGAMEGIDKLLEKQGIGLSQVGMLVHGTTLATNNLIEKKGARVGVIATEGFRDILEIGYERRYKQEDLHLDKPDLLVPRERCLVVRERLSPSGAVLTPLDEAGVATVVARLDELGIESVAVCLLHAYANPVHEKRIGELLAGARPDLAVSLSSGVSPEIREFDRLCTTVANAYVKPSMTSYLERFERTLRDRDFTGTVFIMTSSGGMTTLETARQYPVRLVESGPSGGAILAAQVAQRCRLDRVVSFDMGGTTAKFCLIDGGKPQTSRNFEAARAERFTKGSGIPLRIPAIEMIEIGAGGGSVASVDLLERIAIGPESMGSEPGPACFARGGANATVTDADVVLGNIDAARFAEGELTIEPDRAHTAVTGHVGERLGLESLQAADAISRMVSENMANAGRVHAAERGAGLEGRSMIAFGGNGPLHATRVARRMGVSRVIVPVDPGVGSAMGFLSAPISYEIVSSHHTTLERFDFEAINALLADMSRSAVEVVGVEGGPPTETRSAFMRYAGQGHEIEVELPARPLRREDLDSLVKAYESAYKAQFQRTVPGMRIEIMNWALRVESRIEHPTHQTPQQARTQPQPFDWKQIYLGSGYGTLRVPMYERAGLRPGDCLEGPVLIVEPQTSTLVEPSFDVAVDAPGNLILTRRQERESDRVQGTRVEAVDRQLMWNRLLAVVEEQAQALVRAAFSPIVRECGDISAGIFDRRGRMLAQAVTGTPGHINTMASGVANFIDACPLARMSPGDIYVTNDPWLAAGHLNDFMLVQPLFRGGEVVGFASCTSHLVDVGGKCMGPEGADVYDEGIRIPICPLVSGGEVDRTLLNIISANSRRPVENEGDLYALIACCEVGNSRLGSMMDEYGLDSLEDLSDHIVATSRRATLAAIGELPRGRYRHTLTLDGFDLDIVLEATLSVGDEGIDLDFGGSSPCSKFGINVPINYAAAYSVFAIRCAVCPGIPNNAGSLEPFRVTAPEGSIVNALDPAPVAMRHTIGQLLPDLVFGCLQQVLPAGVPAEGASCMYDLPLRSLPATRKTAFAIELVHNGGTGARPAKDGLSATAYPSGVWGSQVEVTECAAPLRVRRRELRPDSGGAGRFRGGLGQVIEIESAENEGFTLFLSLDRVQNPALGRGGGTSGATGKAALRSGHTFPGRGEVLVPGDDRLIFLTPGGGGHGDPLDRDPECVRRDVLQGLVSAEAAQRTYGVALGANRELDLAATRSLREMRRC